MNDLTPMNECKALSEDEIKFFMMSMSTNMIVLHNLFSKLVLQY